MHISFQPKPLRILAALAAVILFFLLLPKCYTTTASADSGEYTVTYTAQQAADVLDRAGIDGRARGEALSLEELARVSDALQELEH